MTYDSPEYNPEDETHKNIEKELWTQLNNNNYDQKISSVQKILSDISVTLDLNTLICELTRWKYSP